MAKQPKTSATEPQKTDTKAAPTEYKFPIPRQNFKLLAIGFGIIVLGFILMVGGGTKDPNVFNYDGLFGFQRRTLAPVVVLIGFAFEVYAIMRRPKDKE